MINLQRTLFKLDTFDTIITIKAKKGENGFTLIIVSALFIYSFFANYLIHSIQWCTKPDQTKIKSLINSTSVWVLRTPHAVFLLKEKSIVTLHYDTVSTKEITDGHIWCPDFL